MTPLEFAYRQTAADGASGFSLLIPLFDRIAGDLRCASEAQRAGNLERRARELNHALSIIGFLENWIEADSGELAQQMVRFYARLRHRIIAAQAKQSASMLDEEMAATLQMRQIWQQLAQATPSADDREPIQTPNFAGAFQPQSEHAPSSWSA